MGLILILTLPNTCWLYHALEYDTIQKKIPCISILEPLL